MKLFVCFGGSAAVLDDDMEAVAAPRHRRERAPRSQSFRGDFFSGSRSSKCSMKKPLAAAMALASPPAPEAKKLGMEADDDAYGLTRASAAAASVPSSAPLSSAVSLDSDSPSASSASRSSASSVSSSPSASGVLFPPPAAARRKGSSTTTSPAAGAAAVVLCLLMVVFCGRVGATVLTSAALYLFPLRWHARPTGMEEDGVGSLECDDDEETRRDGEGRRGSGFLLKN